MKISPGCEDSQPGLIFYLNLRNFNLGKIFFKNLAWWYRKIWI